MIPQNPLFKKSLPFVITSLMIMAFSFKGLAQWSIDPAINNAISIATNNQENPQIISDEAGGAIITWRDSRNTNYDIYAQRIDASGNIHSGWTNNGVVICSASGNQVDPKIVSDGAGGAIITWHDARSGYFDIYAQRIDASGSIHTGWAANGEVICAATGHQENPQIISDEASGAIITWEEYRNGSNSDIYAQHIDASGDIHTGWPADGELICSAADNQNYPTIASDGAGGAIITWMDGRNGNDPDIYALRIDASGAIHSGWTADGELICSVSDNQLVPTIISDGGGGAIITWHDGRNGFYDIYAQRIDESGSIHTGWATNGEVICSAIKDQLYTSIVSDGAGGAIITWYDYRSGSNFDIYAQRIDASGDIHTGWITNGEVICSVNGLQTNPQIISDGAEGAIITWEDYRSVSSSDIYAQHIDASGDIHTGWTANGEVICSASGNQNNPTIASNGAGGAIITWHDSRSNLDIYAQKISSSGTLGGSMTLTIKGNGSTPAFIIDGDVTPSVLDSTDFGIKFINTSLDHRYTIQNTSGSAISISSIVVSGTNAGEFSVSEAPSSIAANSSTTFKVRFIPASTGIRTATITINSNDASIPVYNYNIQGNGSTTYIYNGSGNWTDQSNWSPYYPGLTIPAGFGIEVTSGSVLNINGIAVINNGTINNNGTLNISGGTLTNNGTYEGSGSYSGAIFVNPPRGIVTPGD